MNEEAGFIAALLAEPNDRTTLLVYADWLDERSDPRAEYLRLLAAEKPNQSRLAQLLGMIDPIWVFNVRDRCGCGTRVRVLDGSFAHQEGTVIDLRADPAAEVTAVVRLLFWGRPLDVDLPCRMVERIAESVG
jgi:uncharacterized protein (TIGR02996 family)